MKVTFPGGKDVFERSSVTQEIKGKQHNADSIISSLCQQLEFISLKQVISHKEVRISYSVITCHLV
jgi:hypothetical protein